MRRQKQTLAATLLLAGLWLALTASVQAGDDPFKALVEQVENAWGVERESIPGGWLAGLALHFVKPDGVKGIKFATFEDGRLPADPDWAALEDNILRTLGPGWGRLLFQQSRRGGESSLIYARPEKNEVRMVILTLEEGEAVLLSLRLEPETFREWMKEPCRMARRVEPSKS